MAAYTGEVEWARSMSAEAERRGRTAAPTWTVAEVLMLRGQLYRALGDPATAIATLQTSIDLARESGHDWCEGSALWNAGKAAWDSGDIAGATRFAAASARLQEQAGDLTSWLVSVHMLAGLAALGGAASVGAELLGAVASYGARLGFDPVAMDPLDCPRHVAAVEERLAGDEFAAGLTRGAALDGGGVMALVADVEVQANRARLP